MPHKRIQLLCGIFLSGNGNQHSLFIQLLNPLNLPCSHFEIFSKGFGDNNYPF